MPKTLGTSAKKNTRGCLIVPILFVLGLFRIELSFATGSTQIWNPSTDIQKTGTIHLGIDNYFSVVKNSTKPYQINPDLGVTVGVWKYLEVGIDMIQPSPDPFYLNLKLGLPESGSFPALAIGGCNIGTKKDVTDYNMLYGVAAKTLPPVGRLTLGVYRGMRAELFPDGKGKNRKDGVIATWDKVLTDKIWVCIDYASGKSWYGSLSLGVSYAFSSNVSAIFGYVFFNNRDIVLNDTFTTQLDINLP
jgi:hypothetical protein